jgi:hypothetical protein
MTITLLGLGLIPLSLYWAFRPLRLLQLTLVSAIFEAAAAVAFGGFGLQPATVPGLLFIVYIISQYAAGMRYPGEGRVFRALLPLLLLLFYAVMSAWLLPDAFAGRLMVSPQKQDPLLPGVFVPLQSTYGNVTQPLYLALNITFTVAVAIFLTRTKIPYQSIIAAYLLSGYVAVALVFWQFGSRITGVPFPDDLLQSNPGWAIVKQAIGSVPRIQGSFTEPTALAGYMCGIAFCCLWISVRGYRILRPNLLFTLALASILLSTSTTGIITVLVGLPLTFVAASLGGGRAALSRIGRSVGLLLLGAVIAVGPILLLRPALLGSVEAVIEATLSKGESDSYRERSAWDAGALDTFAPTYGLGVGWGSYRSSSLVPGLTANGGLFCITMIIWLIVRVMRLSGRRRATFRSHSGQMLVSGFSASLCSQLATALMAAPMINSLAFFLQLGCIVGTLVRMSIEARPPSRSAAQLRVGLNQPSYSLARDRSRSLVHGAFVQSPKH